jgi:hypothetical protein
MSRGFHVKEIPAQLPVEKFKNRKGLGESTLHAKAKKGAPAPRKLAEYLLTEEGLPTRKGFEKTAKVVRLGLAAFSGLPSPTIGKKLDTLLTEVAAIRTVLKVGLHVTTTILLLAGLMLAGRHLRADVSRTPTSAAEALLRAALGGLLDLGKKGEEEEQKIPDAPASWQKLAKDCDRSLGEVAINGGCWFASHDVRPPCGKLFRHGDLCYRPVAADPTKPVGLVRAAPGQQ